MICRDVLFFFDPFLHIKLHSSADNYTFNSSYYSSMFNSNTPQQPPLLPTFSSLHNNNNTQQLYSPIPLSAPPTPPSSFKPFPNLQPPSFLLTPAAPTTTSATPPPLPQATSSTPSAPLPVPQPSTSVPPLRTVSPPPITIPSQSQPSSPHTTHTAITSTTTTTTTTNTKYISNSNTTAAYCSALKILIAEDNKMNQEVCCGVLLWCHCCRLVFIVYRC